MNNTSTVETLAILTGQLCLANMLLEQSRHSVTISNTSYRKMFKYAKEIDAMRIATEELVNSKEKLDEIS